VAPVQYTITATAGAGGTISPSGAVTVASGGSRTFTIAANSGYRIAGVTLNGAPLGPVISYTFTNVRANWTIAATFTATSTVRHLITATAGPGGRISPAGDVLVPNGGSRTYTITPNSGYRILDVKVNGGSVGVRTTYTFTNVTRFQTISAVFEQSARMRLQQPGVSRATR